MGGKAFNGKRCPLPVAEEIGNRILSQLSAIFAIERGIIAGSVRRKSKEVGDIDIVIEPKNREMLDKWLRDNFGTLINGYTPKRSGLIDGVQIDIVCADYDSWGAACMHCTGSVKTNIRMRARAQELGMKLNEKGLWKDGMWVAGKTEEEVYKALGVTYQQPEER